MAVEMGSGGTPSASHRDLVRCTFCKGTMQEGLFRCPHCGQITTGNEKKVSELALSMQMRARVAERKSHSQCKNCRAPITKGEMCDDCAKHRRNIFVAILVGVLLLLILVYWI
jgi:hypothetical protein